MKTKGKALELIQSIDWSELRTQKSILLGVLCSEEGNIVIEPLEGLISLIDNLQDFAVDVLLIDEMHIFDFDEEEQRENETPEELFARENADLIFQMHIEGDALYNEGLSEEFINSIVDNQPHIAIIKSKIKKIILHDLKNMPEIFQRDENGKLTYDYEMYDYGIEIIRYCKKQWKKVKYEKKLIGFQVVNERNEIHPNMDGSFCVYNFQQVSKMISKGWIILPIYEGDIEEPTICF